MTGYLLKINTIDLTPYISEYKVERPKLVTDAGRNLKGDLRASFLGIYPKINLTFKALTESETSTVVGLLDNASFTVNWWDPGSQTYKSGTFYAGDFDSSLIIKNRGIYAGFRVNLISFSKMT